MLFIQMFLSELTALLNQCYVSDPEKRSTKGAELPDSAQRIMELIVLLFGDEMELFAKSLCKKGMLFDHNDLVQGALTQFMAKSKWQAFSSNRAGDTGVIGWYRFVYKNSIRDEYGEQMRYLSRHLSLDGNWWEESHQGEYW